MREGEAKLGRRKSPPGSERGMAAMIESMEVE
jgi:hypothetical protein